MVLIARGNQTSGDGGFIGYTNAQDGDRRLSIGAVAVGKIKLFASIFSCLFPPPKGASLFLSHFVHTIHIYYT